MDRTYYENGSAPHKIACNLCSEEFYSITAHETTDRHQRVLASDQARLDLAAEIAMQSAAHRMLLPALYEKGEAK